MLYLLLLSRGTSRITYVYLYTNLTLSFSGIIEARRLSISSEQVHVYSTITITTTTTTTTRPLYCARFTYHYSRSTVELEEDLKVIRFTFFSGNQIHTLSQINTYTIVSRSRPGAITGCTGRSSEFGSGRLFFKVKLMVDRYTEETTCSRKLF